MSFVNGDNAVMGSDGYMYIDPSYVDGLGSQNNTFTNWQDLYKNINPALSYDGSLVPSGDNRYGSVANNNPNTGQGWWGLFWQNYKDGLSNEVGAISKPVIGAVNTTKEAGGLFWNNYIDGLKSEGNAIKDVAGNAVSGVDNFVSSTINNVFLLTVGTIALLLIIYKKA